MRKSIQRILVLLLIASLIFPYASMPVSAESTVKTSLSAISGNYYDLNEDGSIIEETETSNPTRTVTDESGNYNNISKEISNRGDFDTYDITLTVETTTDLSIMPTPKNASVVLVFDVSTSMDFAMTSANEVVEPEDAGWALENTLWSSLKEAAKEFISGLLADGTNSVSIVVYGGANVSTATIVHETICDWTSDANTAISSFYDYEVVCQSYVQYSSNPNGTSLRYDVFGDDSTDYGSTNSQAGFVGASEQLSKLTNDDDQYVIYMSDGEATSSYDSDTAGTGAINEQPAIKEAALLKTNYPNCKLYTVGFGSSAAKSAVLQKSTNTSVDEYYSAENASKLKSVYETIQNQIDLLSKLWTVTDPMSQYVTCRDDSLSGDGSYSIDEDGVITWSLLGYEPQETYTDNSGNTIYVYTLTYTIVVELNYSDIVDIDTPLPTNGVTTITYDYPDENGNYAYSDIKSTEFLIPTVFMGYTIIRHVAYINGYEDGTVRPEANISRAETASIAFRLLSESARTYYWSKTNSYSDVNTTDWYNNAISTMTNANIINGYTDGTFLPNSFITRAEFAKIMVGLDSVTYTGEDKFIDISDHWARDYINAAAERGWVVGYDDDSEEFRPDAYITRAEAVTLVNRMLGRDKVAEMCDDMIIWPDNSDPTAWYYSDIQEATNSHICYINNSGYEIWTEIVNDDYYFAPDVEWENAV